MLAKHYRNGSSAWFAWLLTGVAGFFTLLVIGLFIKLIRIAYVMHTFSTPHFLFLLLSIAGMVYMGNQAHRAMHELYPEEEHQD